MRVHKACELMALYPEKTITAIFLGSGFASKSPFNNAFKDIMNTSPTKYRFALKKQKN